MEHVSNRNDHSLFLNCMRHFLNINIQYNTSIIRYCMYSCNIMVAPQFMYYYGIWLSTYTLSFWKEDLCLTTSMHAYQFYTLPNVCAIVVLIFVPYMSYSTLSNFFIYAYSTTFKICLLGRWEMVQVYIGSCEV